MSDGKSKPAARYTYDTWTLRLDRPAVRLSKLNLCLLFEAARVRRLPLLYWFLMFRSQNAGIILDGLDGYAHHGLDGLRVGYSRRRRRTATC